MQQTENGAVSYVESLPAKGRRTFAPAAAPAAAERFVLGADGHTLETPFYAVRFDGNGQIAGLFDKENRREVLQAGKTGNLLRVFEDKPIYYDNWDIDIYYTEKFWDVTDLKEFRWTETGPVRATLYIERAFSNSTIAQDIHFYADTRRIDFVTTGTGTSTSICSRCSSRSMSTPTKQPSRFSTATLPARPHQHQLGQGAV